MVGGLIELIKTMPRAAQNISTARTPQIYR
jgi:hypothetical protein